MKLCQKCKNNLHIRVWTEFGMDDIITEMTSDIETVSKSECEFWAHKELNRWKQLTERELGGMPKW